MPDIDPTVFLAPNSFVSGDVTIGEDSSIWPGASLRGDMGPIIVGRASSIQDSCTCHLMPGSKVEVGDLVTVGHGAVLHGCKIGDCTVVGMNSTVLDNAVVGKCCIIAAGSVVKGGTQIPDWSLAAGSPAQVKPVNVEPFMNWYGALLYTAMAAMYKEGCERFDMEEITKRADALKEKYPMPE